MKSDYEQRQEDRRERYEDRADRNQREGEAKTREARRRASLIPFGQPILVGHHSERRDRNYRERFRRLFESGFEQMDKARYWRARAASVGTGGISSDDPNAIEKLREKLAERETLQEQMKAINLAHKRFLKNPDSLEKSGLSESVQERIRNYKPQYSWEPHPIAPYQFTNNGAEIRRLKKRIEYLEQKERVAETLRAENKRGDAIKSEEYDGLRIEENHEENRVFIFFPAKPSEAIRKACKGEGFRWAPSVGKSGAWSRHHSSGAVYSARRVKDLWLKEREQ